MPTTSEFPPAICVVGFHHARYELPQLCSSARAGACCVLHRHTADDRNRGPEIETWYGLSEGADPATDNDWSFLPFMALSDGAHTFVHSHVPQVCLFVRLTRTLGSFSEDFSYFTLRKKPTGESLGTSLFGMSCTRQLDAKELIERPADVTRSTVQKSVVIVAQSPHLFPGWREKLSMVTKAWFMQRCVDFP